MSLSIGTIIVQILVTVFVSAPLLWLIGNGLSKNKVRFTGALLIEGVGILVGTLLGFLSTLTGMSNTGWVIVSLVSTSLVLLVLRLTLIRSFFGCGWMKAFSITIVVGTVFGVIVGMVLLVVGILSLDLLLKLLAAMS
jgi:hypothetical protein